MVFVPSAFLGKGPPAFATQALADGPCPRFPSCVAGYFLLLDPLSSLNRSSSRFSLPFQGGFRTTVSGVRISV